MRILFFFREAFKFESLGDKRYSDESYEEYLSLYNVILNTIQNATDIAVLDMLDVDAYRTNAESKLVPIKTPETEESDTDSDTDGGETDENESESESESEESEETESETEKKSKKKGCRSSAGITSLAIVTLISAAGVTLRKIRRRD